MSLVYDRTSTSESMILH